jgi:predicted cobalt transporter CbtA
VASHSRLRGQDGFIREVVWIAVILGVIAVVVLDGMAIFNAYQSSGDSAEAAANAALTEYAQSHNAATAKLAAQERLDRGGLKMVAFEVGQSTGGATLITVTAKDHADTYAFHYLSAIPQLKKWVERTTNPVRSGSAE